MIALPGFLLPASPYLSGRNREERGPAVRRDPMTYTRKNGSPNTSSKRSTLINALSFSEVTLSDGVITHFTHPGRIEHWTDSTTPRSRKSRPSAIRRSAESSRVRFWSSGERTENGHGHKASSFPDVSLEQG